jgi:hypothetical protein
MKAKIIPIIYTLFFSFILLLSCEDTTYKEYTGNAPVYLSYDDLRSAVVMEENVPLENPGKIYFKDNFIFIIEELKGIHVYDNTNPSSPVKETFIRLPGVVDMSITGNILYADSFVDLVVLDVKNISNIEEVGRVKSILPYTVPPVVDDKYPVGYVDEKKGVVTGWELKTIRERVDIHYDPYPVFWDKGIFLSAMSSRQVSGGVTSGGVGFGGSMARFGIHENVLYVLDQNTLKVFDITNKEAPRKHNEINPGWGVETMFLTEKTMFLGTTTGMVIYDISVPLSPQSRIFFSHARSCDPVVVDDTLAYITLRTGTNCGGSTNTLSVVNIKNLSTPKLVMTYPMVNPHGLGKDGDLLFICDGSAGLKVYDAADPKTILSHLIYTYSSINAYDVIPIGDLLILIGDDGLYQYDYSNIQSISLLSSILSEKR